MLQMLRALCLVHFVQFVCYMYPLVFCIFQFHGTTYKLAV